MINQTSRVPGSRRLHWAKLALAVAAGSLPLADRAMAAGGSCGCHSQRGCGDACCEPRPGGPIFKTLDTLAGGIETVLQKTVLNRNASLFSGRGGKRSCDDACDAMIAHSHGHPHADLVPLPPANAHAAPLPQAQSAAPQRPGVPTLLPESQPEVNHVPPAMAGPPSSGRPRLIETPAGRSTLPQVPADSGLRSHGATTEEDFLDSFGPPSSHRSAAPLGNQHREVYGDPFQDDPQTQYRPPANRQLMLQPPGNAVPQRQPIKAAGFRGR